MAATKSKAKPTNPALYARVKAEAKRKFDVYPSAYANAWLVRTYKKRGGVIGLPPLRPLRESPRQENLLQEE